MQTVSTLCASGSIVSAASIGFTFGETPSPPSNRVAHPQSPPSTTQRKDRRSLFRGSTSGSVASLASSRPATPLHKLVQSTPSSSPNTIQEGPGPETLPEEVLSILPHSSHDRKLYTQEEVAPTIPSSSLKRASSRLSRRFSSFSLSGLGSSPSDRLQSGRPPTSSDLANPSFSAPGEDEIARPSPNKLVKRSLSKRVLTSSGEDTVIHTLTLERPATRHKRSATLLSESWTNFTTIAPISTDHAPPRAMLPAYFSSIPSQEFDPGARRPTFGTFSERPLTRQLAPRASASPMLCHSNSVAPITLSETSPSAYSDSPFAFGRRPSSSGLVNFFSSPVPPIDTRDLQPPRSTSVHNLFARVAPSKQRSKPSKVQSSDRRVVSAPASTMVGHDATEGGEPNIDRPSTDKQGEQPKSHVRGAAPYFFDSSPLAQVATASGAQGQSESPRSVSFGSPLANLPLRSGSRRSRYSVAFSDIGSSQPGSEADSKVFSSGDSDELRSDTAYDSIRTGMTKSSSNYQGPALETLFDSSPRLSSAQTSPLQFDMGTPSPMDTKGQIIFEEDSSTSTPGRTVIQGHRESHEQERSDHTPTAPATATTNPALSLGRLPWDAEIDREEVEWPENMEEEDWASEGDVVGSSSQAQSSQSIDHSLGSVRRKLKFLTLEQSSSDNGQRNDLLNWSESAAPSDRAISDSPPARPQTAYGKKHEEVSRDGAGAGRAPGGLHARSKSVPALAALAGHRSSVANKFGTWDIGTKEGIKKEDWDDDFDFDEDPDMSALDLVEAFPTHHEPKKVMVVPETIRAQQSNVLANIGLLKEWGLRIEELKVLKRMIISIGIEVKAHAAILEDIDGMIALADQEFDNSGLPSHQTPTSSPAFGFDDPVQPSPLLVAQDLNARNADDDEDDEVAPIHTPAHFSITSSTLTGADQSSILNRPRKDSEAVAVSVIETLQKQRSMKFLGTPDRPSAKRIPFDTTTLKRIVPHVNDLVKSMKQIIDDAQGLDSSPKSTFRSVGDALHEDFFLPPTVIGREKHDIEGPDDFW